MSKEGHLVCNGAECECQHGDMPDKLVVSTITKHYINDPEGSTKTVATDKELGQPFEKKTFGKCKLHPTPFGYKPCQPNITEWKGFYDKMKYEENDGSPLLEGSKAVCAIAGRPCVSISFHGQKAEPVASNFEETEQEQKVMAQINPIPIATTDTQDDTMVGQTIDNEEIISKIKPIKKTGNNDSIKIREVAIGEDVTLKVETEKKWVWIKKEYLQDVGDYSNGEEFSKWGNWKSQKSNTKSIEKYGIGKQYAQSKAIRFTGITDANKGVVYWLEAFTDEPKLDAGDNRLGLYLVTVDKPAVISCFFNKGKHKVINEELTNLYGEVIPLTINTHLLPDYTKDYHTFALFEIDIYDWENDSKVNNEPERYVQLNTYNTLAAYNTVTSVNLLIRPEWKKKLQHETGVKKFYVKINTTLYSNKDAAVKSKQKFSLLSFEERFNTIAPNGEEISVKVEKKDFHKEHWWEYFLGRSESSIKSSASAYIKEKLPEFNSKEECQYYNEITRKNENNYFLLSSNTFSGMLNIRQIDTGKMVAKVRDVKYNYKKNEPCKFTAITVFLEEDKTAFKTNPPTPITIFKEGDSVMMDETQSRIIGVTASDSKTKIKIKLEGLAIKDYQSEGEEAPMCDQIGLKEGQVHKTTTIVDKSLLRPQWIDPEKDVDIKGDTIEFNVGYHYDKTVADGTKYRNSTLDKLWLFKYFKLSDDLVQSHFLPISTCRYPNQMVKIDVYPDITWGVSLSFGSGASAYQKDWRKDLTKERKAALEELEDAKKAVKKDVVEKINNAIFRKRNVPALSYVEISAEEKPKSRAEKIIEDLELELAFNARYNGENTNVAIDFGGSIKEIVMAFAEAYGLLKDLTGNSYNEAEQKTKMEETKKKLNGIKKVGNRFDKLFENDPVTINLATPKFSIGTTWGRTTIKDTGQAPVSYDVYAQFSPLVEANGKLDLITCAGFIPLEGQVIKLVELVLTNAGLSPSCFIELVGSIKGDIKGSIRTGVDGMNSVESSITNEVKLRIEASITLGGGVVGFIFAAIEKDMTAYYDEVKYRAIGEIGFKNKKELGADHNGVYFDYMLKFNGLKFVAKKEQQTTVQGEVKKDKVKVGEEVSEEELGQFVVIPRKIFMGGKTYFKLQQNDETN